MDQLSSVSDTIDRREYLIVLHVCDTCFYQNMGVALPWLWLLLATGALLECIIACRNAGEANLGLGEVGLKVILKSGWGKKKACVQPQFPRLPQQPT